MTKTINRGGQEWPVLSAAEMAALCGFGQEMLRRIERSGAFKKLGTDRYSPPEVFIGVLTYMRDEGRRATKSEAARRVQEARAKEIELRVAERQGRLIDVDTLDAVLADILGAARSELAGVPAASTRDMELRALFEKNLNDAIDRARARFEERIEALLAGRDIFLETEETDS